MNIFRGFSGPFKGLGLWVQVFRAWGRLIALHDTISRTPGSTLVPP